MRIDRKGSRFGRLTFEVASEEKTADGSFKWWLLCDCGSRILRDPARVVHGQIKSCGCLHREKTKERLVLRNTTHGHAPRGKVSSTYRHWQYIFDRLKNDPDYAGVTVCERWLKFENFLEDMGLHPAGLSLDRIDNNKGYEPGNCRWATMETQQNNRTNNLVITHNGISQSLSLWCRSLGLPYESTRVKFHRLGRPANFISLVSKCN